MIARPRELAAGVPIADQAEDPSDPGPAIVAVNDSPAFAELVDPTVVAAAFLGVTLMLAAMFE